MGKSSSQDIFTAALPDGWATPVLLSFKPDNLLTNPTECSTTGFQTTNFPGLFVCPSPLFFHSTPHGDTAKLSPTSDHRQTLSGEVLVASVHTYTYPRLQMDRITVQTRIKKGPVQRFKDSTEPHVHDSKRSLLTFLTLSHTVHVEFLASFS